MFAPFGKDEKKWKQYIGSEGAHGCPIFRQPHFDELMRNFSLFWFGVSDFFFRWSDSSCLVASLTHTCRAFLSCLSSKARSAQIVRPRFVQNGSKWGILRNTGTVWIFGDAPFSEKSFFTSCHCHFRKWWKWWDQRRGMTSKPFQLHCWNHEKYARNMRLRCLHLYVFAHQIVS